MGLALQYAARGCKSGQLCWHGCTSRTESALAVFVARHKPDWAMFESTEALCAIAKTWGSGFLWARNRAKMARDTAPSAEHVVFLADVQNVIPVLVGKVFLVSHPFTHGNHYETTPYNAS